MAIERISIDDLGIEGNTESFSPRISGDGQFVAFHSDATNLVTGDTNAAGDVFVVDRSGNTIERVSINNAGVEGDAGSFNPALSSDGRFVAFHSFTTNLVTDDSGLEQDVFVFDRDSQTIERVSVNNSGSEGDDASSRPAISSDGRFVAFQSLATNLVAGDLNAVEDVFVFDRDSQTIERVSVDNSGSEGDAVSSRPSISSDGRFVAFQSLAANLVTGDSNAKEDIFVFDRNTNTIERVSLSSAGSEGDGDSTAPSISSDGRFVAFDSDATNLVSGDTNGASDIFVIDRNTNTIERVSISDSGSEGNGNSQFPAISGDGRFVTFHSNANNFVAGDTNGLSDIYLVDRDTDTIERISIDNSGAGSDNQSFAASISNDGNFITFHSLASNLASNDTNSEEDIFVVARRLTAETPNIKLIQLGGTTRSFENYASDTYQVLLTAQPLTDVTISLSADNDLTVDPTQLTFTTANFNTVQTVAVTGQVDQAIAERTLNITHSINSLDTNYEILTIDPVQVSLTDTTDTSDLPEQNDRRARVLSPTTDIITALESGSFILGKAGNDVLLGQTGQDKLYGGDGDDYLSGGNAHDYLNGNAGDDLIDGGDDFDVLYGSDGNDILNGDGGDDSLFGGRGEDELFGGAGNDTLTGGLDADVFVLGKNRGIDTFEDFSAGFDRVNLIDGLTFDDLTIEQSNATTTSQILETATGSLLAVLSTTPVNTISATDFF